MTFFIMENEESFSHLRATASVSVKLSFYFTLKAYFFYFIHQFLQNTHINLSILPSILFK